MEQPNGRVLREVGNTELIWCRAVPGGTGIAVLVVLLSNDPGIALPSALRKLQDLHPVLRSKLRHENSTNNYYFVLPSSPTVQIKSFDLREPQSILTNASLSPLHLILEEELNHNQWNNHDGAVREEEQYVMHASMYKLPGGKWAVALRIHVAACDRKTTVSVLEELLKLLAQKEEHEATNRGTQRAIEPCIEDVVPSEKMGRKNLLEKLAYSFHYWVSSLWLSNLKFDNTGCSRASRVVRLKLSKDDTEKILSECKTRDIKLCGALAASAMLAAYKSETGGMYRVVTLVDCRSLLNPPISQHSLGFYHSAILNTHVMKGRKSFWDTASKAYEAFRNSKENDKHFLDMADLNNLMCEAIDKLGQNKSSSQRTSLVSVFEDPVIDDSRDGDARGLLGREDYMGCASVHGIGPSLVIYNTIRDGSLDCVCVFPAHLHSMKQMQEFADRMEKFLINRTP